LGLVLFCASVHSPEWEGEVDLQAKVILNWKTSDKGVTLRLVVADNSWIGLGWNPDVDEGGEMTHADMAILGAGKDGQMVLEDYWSYGFYIPDPDVTDNLEDMQFGQNDSQTWIQFFRVWHTGDDQDKDLLKKRNFIIWAYGDSNELSYHGKYRGHKIVDFSQQVSNNEHSDRHNDRYSDGLHSDRSDNHNRHDNRYNDHHNDRFDYHYNDRSDDRHKDRFDDHYNDRSDDRHKDHHHKDSSDDRHDDHNDHSYGHNNDRSEGPYYEHHDRSEDRSDSHHNNRHQYDDYQRYYDDYRSYVAYYNTHYAQYDSHDDNDHYDSHYQNEVHNDDQDYYNQWLSLRME